MAHRSSPGTPSLLIEQTGSPARNRDRSLHCRGDARAAERDRSDSPQYCGREQRYRRGLCRPRWIRRGWHSLGRQQHDHRDGAHRAAQARLKQHFSRAHRGRLRAGAFGAAADGLCALFLAAARPRGCRGVIAASRISRSRNRWRRRFRNPARGTISDGGSGGDQRCRGGTACARLYVR